jgi:hypothetical protein
MLRGAEIATVNAQLGPPKQRRDDLEQLTRSDKTR